MRLLFGVLLVGSAACGPSAVAPDRPVAPDQPAASASASSGEAREAACLARATAERTKRANEPDRITVSHVLVRHATSARPDGATRTRGQACVRAEEARDQVRAGVDWDLVVAEFSEEPGAKSRSGSVGEATRAMLVVPFADAAFELEIQQLSDVVESKFGFHLILRTQ